MSASILVITICGYWLFGFAGAVLARAAWRLEFDKPPLTRGTLILMALAGFTGPFTWLGAAVWFGMWAFSGRSGNSQISRWLSAPVFKDRKAA